MKRQIALSLLTLAVLAAVTLKYTKTASSSSLNRRVTAAEASFAMPMFVTTLDVDRTDDVAAASACTVAPNDCSFRGAVTAANADLGATPVVINLQPATTYNLTLANATQENAAATGDLDITTTLHSVTVSGGGSSTIIDAAGLTSGSMHDRSFQITGTGLSAIFQDLVIQNGKALGDLDITTTLHSVTVSGDIQV